MPDFIIPTDIDNRFKRDKSKETYKTYTSMLGKMFREIWDTNEYSLSKMRDFSTVKRYINIGKLSVTSKKIITIASVMILKASKAPQTLIDEYGKLAREYRIKDSKMRKDRSATAKERETLLDWPDILQIKKCYKKCLEDKFCTDEMTELEYKRWYMKYVALSLFTMIPPQRGQVFYNCYIDKDISGSNIIDTDKSELKIRNEKTTKTYGTRIIPLPKELNNIIKEWKKIAGPPYLLMPSTKNEKLSSPAWTQFMNSIFKRDMSTDMLRKIYVSYMIGEKGINPDERKQLAEDMGHSLSVQQHMYNKGDWN